MDVLKRATWFREERKEWSQSWKGKQWKEQASEMETMVSDPPKAGIWLAQEQL